MRAVIVVVPCARHGVEHRRGVERLDAALTKRAILNCSALAVVAMTSQAAAIGSESTFAVRLEPAEVGAASSNAAPHCRNVAKA